VASGQALNEVLCPKLSLNSEENLKIVVS